MGFPTPKDLGLPSMFKTWRRNQVQAIQDGLDCDKRFIVQSQKQGDGKTLTYMAQGLIDENSRWIYNTSTKGLQDQNLETYESIGLVDIRGKAAYQCSGTPGHTCAEGSVAKCIYKGSSMCDYHNARHEASTKRLVQTNYPCWIASNKYAQGFGAFNVMVCDEAHNIPMELEKSMQVSLGEREICEDLKREWPDARSRFDMEAWKHWALVSRVLANQELQRLKIEIEKAGSSKSIKMAKEYNHYNNLVRRLADIATCRVDSWVADEWSHGYKFDPIDASSYAEKVLFRGIPKIILVSGTIKPKTLEQAGVDMSDCKFFSYQSELNPTRTPIMYIPTAKVNFYSQPWELRRLVARIDEIFESRSDRKGIIHTSNYKIRDFIMSNSKYSRYFMSNYTQNGELTGEVVSRFKQMDAPAVLVSPSVTTGYDFPYDLCRYQIIAKLNYPYAASRVEQERLRRDPERGSYHAVLQLQQAATRGDRAGDDFQEVFILDDAFPMLKWKYESLFNPSFLICCKQLNKVPPAPVLEAA